MEFSYEAVDAASRALEKYVADNGTPQPWQGFRSMAESALRAALPYVGSTDASLWQRVRSLEERLEQREAHIQYLESREISD